MSVAAIVPAAGSGVRLRARRPKAFVRFGSKPLLIHTLEALRSAYPFRRLIVAVAARELRRAERLLGRSRAGRGVRLVPGGSTRARSVRSALREASDCRWVLIHDAARPLVGRRLVRRAIAAARQAGVSGAVCAVPVTSTVKRSDASARRILGTPDRSRLYLAQTPQVFDRERLEGRYRAVGRRWYRVTDEAALFDGSGQTIRLVAGEESNIKITTPSDALLWRCLAGAGRRS